MVQEELGIHIQVWFDDDSSYPESRLWCVSLCDCTGEIKCLSIHDTEAEAIAAATLAADAKGLGAYRSDRFGVLTEIR